MTEKQEKILEAALELFAAQGFAATSTSKVAKAAGVSEGLIFRHFENKEGLLSAILEKGHEKLLHMVSVLKDLTDPKEVIRQVIELPFNIKEEEFPFWKLMYALKWQAEVYDNSMSAPMRAELKKAFMQLGYSNPEAEAECVLVIVDGLATAFLLRKPGNIPAIKVSILNKYQL